MVDRVVQGVLPRLTRLASSNRIALDSDKAGTKAARGWWPETYGAKIR